MRVTSDLHESNERDDDELEVKQLFLVCSKEMGKYTQRLCQMQKQRVSYLSYEER
jgi:hypothetical protein